MEATTGSNYPFRIDGSECITVCVRRNPETGMYEAYIHSVPGVKATDATSPSAALHMLAEIVAAFADELARLINFGRGAGHTEEGDVNVEDVNITNVAELQIAWVPGMGLVNGRTGERLS